MRAINHALTAPTDFLQQFVVTEVDQDVGGRAGVNDSGYSFVRYRAKTRFQNAGQA